MKMTDSEALAVLDTSIEVSVIRCDEQTAREMRQARTHIAEALRDAEVGRKWREDSSLETWFPFTEEKLRRCEADAERYRWLRCSADISWNGWVTHSMLIATNQERADLDAAIDVAMKEAT